jgi:hypothetical protein
VLAEPTDQGGGIAKIAEDFYHHLDGEESSTGTEVENPPRVRQGESGAQITFRQYISRAPAV